MLLNDEPLYLRGVLDQGDFPEGWYSAIDDAQYKTDIELTLALVGRDRGHPCVITWVPFNESWGVWHQDSRPAQRAFVEAMVSLTQALDPTRPVVGNDGWEFSSGDLWALHLIAGNGCERVADSVDGVWRYWF